MKPVRRVVLDTNYFRSLKERDLAPLRERGFLVSVAMSAFYEAWAAAARERKLGLLLGPARALRDIIDPAYPIAPSVGDFLRRFAVVRERQEPGKVTRRYEAWAQVNWQLAANGNVNDTMLASVGLDADAHLTQRGTTWKGYARSWRELAIEALSPQERADLNAVQAATEKAEREISMFRTLSPRKRQSHFVTHISQDLTARGYRAGMVRQRMHAYYHVIALQMWNTARGSTTATENDSEDLANLMHIAEPAFLLTRDDGLIRAVDESGTYQAPWVLRLEEFLRGSLPVGLPWGGSARSEAARFHRGSGR